MSLVLGAIWTFWWRAI